MKPHKHAELIKAWADGAEIEYRYPKDNGDLSLWKDLTQCVFHEWYEYRFKAESKHDVYCMEHFYLSDDGDWMSTNSEPANLKLIFDGETGELKSAEVLK